MFFLSFKLHTQKIFLGNSPKQNTKYFNSLKTLDNLNFNRQFFEYFPNSRSNVNFRSQCKNLSWKLKIHKYHQIFTYRFFSLELNAFKNIYEIKKIK